MAPATATLMPFLYPSLLRQIFSCGRRCLSLAATNCRRQHGLSAREGESELSPPPGPPSSVSSHLNPSPTDYTRTLFTDRCTIHLQAGPGGNGSASFLRDKNTSDGPANGGNGGSGGNIYIQAVLSETSLHKLARQGTLKAGRGYNGRGGSKNGQRGEDVLVQVPVGTVVREVVRYDQVAEEEKRRRLSGNKLGDEGEQKAQWKRDKWLLHPSRTLPQLLRMKLPRLSRARRSNLMLSEVPAPVYLDLSEPMEDPLLIAAGAAGGLGNANFVSRAIPRPAFASRGDPGLQLTLELELKLLADLGLVGLPNAGKSTLLRALTRSRTRVGDWEFTTLQPNIGTVVLDDNRGRPRLRAAGPTKSQRTSFTIADIPGLLPDAHLDKGLGLGFLRHIERAGLLAFVVDLNAGDAVEAVKNLWKEVGEYETLRGMETNFHSEQRTGDRKLPAGIGSSPSAEDGQLAMGRTPNAVVPNGSRSLPPLTMQSPSSKPWFVVATKADLDNTTENFTRLQEYLDAVSSGAVEHPSGRKNGWRKSLMAVPVSAIRGEGVDTLVDVAVALLNN